MKKYLLTVFIIIFSIFIYNILVCNSSVLATSTSSTTTTSIVQVPKNIDDAEALGWKILSGFPDALKGIWQGAIEIWRNIFRKIGNFWNSYIKPYIVNFWERDVEIKKPEVKQELEKEKQEMKVEIPKAGKNIWNRFKDLIDWWNKD